MDYWQRTFAANGRTEITASEDSLIVSILSAGTFFGALFAAPIADFMGRRWGLIVSAAIVFNLGVILQTASTAQPMFIAGRFFAGLGVGLISAMGRSFTSLPVSSLLSRCSTLVPIRDGAEMDSRCHSRLVPASDYDWIAPCQHRQQRDQGPQRFGLLSHSGRDPVRLVYHRGFGHVTSTRDSEIPG